MSANDVIRWSLAAISVTIAAGGAYAVARVIYWELTDD